MKRHLTLVLSGFLLVGCRDANVAGPAPAVSVQPRLATQLSTPSARRVTVMTRNMYIGADVDAVIGALASPDPGDDLPALLGAIAVLQRTDFPARVEALADEIARARPHVVGLQEVDSLGIHLAALGLPQAALAARGLDYAVAGLVTNVTAAPFPGIGLRDHDVILVDAERVTVNPAVTAQTFTFNIGPVAPGVVLQRGLVMIDVTIEGTPIRIASTHLESGGAPGLSALRAAQAAELASVVGAASPAILLGDFNDTPGSTMYGVVTGAGFIDAWGALRPGALGFTCCEAGDRGRPAGRARGGSLLPDLALGSRGGRPRRAAAARGSPGLAD